MAPVVVRSSPVFDFPGDENIGDTFRIDADAVNSRPIRDHLNFYSESGKSVTTLILSEITEQDVELIFSLFKSIQHLTLEKVQILNKDIKGLPTKIACLKLLKCRIVKPVIKRWFKSLGSELTSVLVSASYYAVPLFSEGSLIELLGHLPITVRHLKVNEPSTTHFFSLEELPRAQYLHLDISNSVDNEELNETTKQVETLVLRLHTFNEIDHERDIMDGLKRLKQLQHLRVINPIPMTLMQKLKSLPNLITLDAFCYEQPEEVNKILILNDDCLAHICSYLEDEDWIALTRVHPRLDHVVGTYILPRQDVDWDPDLLNKYRKMVRKEILKRVGETVKTLFVQGEYFPKIASHFKSLETLHLEDEWNSKIRQSIPRSIKKLVLNCNLYDSLYSEDEYDEYDEPMKGQDYSVHELFQSLNPTLTTLELHRGVDSNDLDGLHNIRSFTCKKFKATDMLQFLRRNQKQMEVLKIDFFNEHRRSPKWYASWDDDNFDGPEYQPPSTFRLCPMGALKVLHLDSINCHIDIKPTDFPSLEEIRVSFDSQLKAETVSHILNCVSKFTNLKTLTVQSYIESDFKWLYGMKSLVSLEMNIKGEELLNVLKELPKLSKFKASEDWWSFKFEAELREFLIGATRTLKVYHGGDPVLVIP